MLELAAAVPMTERTADVAVTPELSPPPLPRRSENHN
jgi:hypothetical protein